MGNKIVYQDNDIIEFQANSNKLGDQIVIIDKDDWNIIEGYTWYPHKTNHSNLIYIVCTERKNKTKRNIRINRLIMGANTYNKIVDHKNGNTLDNRKSNLRICTNAENTRNGSIGKHNTSGYKGVSWFYLNNKWRSTIVVNYKQISLGLFSKKEDAAKAYNKAAKKYHGEFAKLNKILKNI
jgi:hypothetical protein